MSAPAGIPVPVRVIEVKGLCKSFPHAGTDGPLQVLKDVNLTVEEGERIAIIGGSGCGKSVFLRSLELLEAPDRGQIFIDGEEITARGANVDRLRRKMGMVYQKFYLFSHMNVMDNLCLAPTRLLGMTRAEVEERAMEWLSKVGLAARARAMPSVLSGGQQQRIAICRSLMMEPRVLLFDEPTSALDPTMVGEVQAVIRDLARTGKTMMVVTHEMNFARSICNRVLYMDEGGIYEDGSPEEIFERPRREKTRRFIRRLKVLERTIEGRDFDFPAAVSAIDAWCQKNLIPRHTCNRLHLAFEELVQQILLPALDDPRVHMAAEYSETDRRLDVSVLYNGPAMDPSGTENTLSWAVLKGAIPDIRYERVEDGPDGSDGSDGSEGAEGYGNRVKLCIHDEDN